MQISTGFLRETLSSVITINGQSLVCRGFVIYMTLKAIVEQLALHDSEQGISGCVRGITSFVRCILAFPALTLLWHYLQVLRVHKTFLVWF